MELAKISQTENGENIVARDSFCHRVLETAVFEIYNSLLPNEAFFGRGSSTGTKIALPSAEHYSLFTIWKDIILRLYVFYLLRALWRWEWNSDHKIDNRDAKGDKEYDNAEKLLFENEIIKKYPQFMNHLKKNILPRKEEWARSEAIKKG